MKLERTETRLNELIRDQIEESDDLDYKAAAALAKESKKMDEIGKDVSAFANSAGGTIIYGIREFREDDKRHLPERLDPINRTQFTREWLEHQINRIAPRIPDLKISPVPLKSGKNDVAYVVDIPKGETAHQAPDGRYYRRYNFESQWMKDHEVRDVMNRKRHPVVETEIKLWIKPHAFEGGLHWRLKNVGSVIARHVMTSIECPMEVKGFFLAEGEGESYKSLSDEANFIFWTLTASNKLGLPLFPGAEMTRLFKFKLSQGVRYTGNVKQLEHIHFCTYADEMPSVSGRIDPSKDTVIISSF